MSRFIRQIVTETQDIIPILNTTIDNNHRDFNTTTPFIILVDNNTKYVKKKEFRKKNKNSLIFLFKVQQFQRFHLHQMNKVFHGSSIGI